ncbi:MAG: ABC transporter ATP-binding protein [Rhizobiaceae bacterium]|nr:ABC transporter ATP-binding protein [Rhizobiaceae bacterium]
MTQNTPTGVEKGTGASIEIQDLSKKFGEFTAVSDFNLSIRGGEFISVLGASGSGKTTVLRILAGLEEPTGGRILIDGQDATLLPSEARDIGLVFQDYALFPHMSVEQNIAFPLRMRKVPKDRIRADVDRILALVGASHLRTRKPNQLSGGQQQRIALARALVFNPKLLLLDEPLSALDKNLREHMKAEIKALHRKTGVTVIYVTHDQSEALALSDRVVVMRDGRILDIDAPDTLYQLPTSSYLATFVGDANLIDGVVASVSGDNVQIDSRLDRIELPKSRVRLESGVSEGARIKLVVRPENIVIDPPQHMDGLLRIDGSILEMLYNGAHTIYTVSSDRLPEPLIARCGQHQSGTFQTGHNVPIGLRTDRFVAVPDNGESVGP